MAERMIETTTYLHISPDRRTYSSKGLVRRHGGTRPAEPDPGCVVVRLVIRIPATAWAPIQGGTIEISEDQVMHPVEVTASDAS